MRNMKGEMKMKGEAGKLREHARASQTEIIKAQAYVGEGSYDAGTLSDRIHLGDQVRKSS